MDALIHVVAEIRKTHHRNRSQLAQAIHQGRFVIFGDNDQRYVGQTCAYRLAERLVKNIDVDVRIPPQPGTDWLDELTGRQQPS